MGFGYKGKRKKVVGNRKKDGKILENINITEDLVSNSKILLVFFSAAQISREWGYIWGKYSTQCCPLTTYC